MTNKKREAKVQKNLEVISFLVRPIDANQFCKEVKLEEHNLDCLVEVALRMRHADMTIKEAAEALIDYYLLNIKPANLFIIGFRFEKAIDAAGKHILKVFATIRVNLESKQCEETPQELREKFLRAQRGLLFNPLG